MGCTSSKEDAMSKNSPQSLDSKQGGDQKMKQSTGTADKFRPNPGFVVKTRNVRNDEKLFINVFHSAFVSSDAPYPFQDAIRMQDKKGDICVAYSVVIPSEIWKKCEDVDFKATLVQREVLPALRTGFPEVDFDTEVMKFPKIRKGYVGSSEGNDQDLSDIPFFSVSSNTTNNTTVVATSNNSNNSNNSNSNNSNSNSNSTGSNATHSKHLAVVHEVAEEEEEEEVVLVGLLPSQPATPPASPLPNSHHSSHHHEDNKAETVPATSSNTNSNTDTDTSSNTAAHTAETAPATAAIHTPPPVAAVTPTPTPTPTPAIAEAEKPRAIKRQSSVVVLPGPPKMTGWLKKRGHVVMNWKTRFFVLNNGFLSYYVDALDRPPYGKNLKGGLCLAGFRDLHSIDQAFFDVAIFKKEVGALQGGRSASTADNNRSAGRSFSIFRRTSMSAAAPPPPEHETRIHLVFCHNLVDPIALQSLRQGLGGITEDDESQKAATTTAKDSHPMELLIEAPSAEEKQAWLAALDAHILYIETAANLNQEQQVEQDEYHRVHGKHVDHEDQEYGVGEEEQFVYTIQAKDDFTVEDSDAVIDNTLSTVTSSPQKPQ